MADTIYRITTKQRDFLKWVLEMKRFPDSSAIKPLVCQLVNGYGIRNISYLERNSLNVLRLKYKTVYIEHLKKLADEKQRRNDDMVNWAHEERERARKITIAGIQHTVQAIQIMNENEIR